MPVADAADAADAMSLHTVFCAECTTYFDWKSLGVFYTHRVSGMPGKITRLLACSDAQLAVYPERGMKMGPTFVHKNYIDDPTRCDPVSKYCDPSSGSYNKPAAVMHWSQEAQIAEEYVLYVDADMLLRAPLDPIELGAKRGRVVSEHVGYLDVGIRNGLVDNFVPGGGARVGARRRLVPHLPHRRPAHARARLAAVLPPDAHQPAAVLEHQRLDPEEHPDRRRVRQVRRGAVDLRDVRLRL